MENGLAVVEKPDDGCQVSTQPNHHQLCSSHDDAVSVFRNQEFIDEKLGKVDKRRDKIDVEMVDGLQVNGDSTSYTLKNEVTSEASLIEAVCVDKFGNGCEKQKAISKFGETVYHSNVEKQESEGGTEKRPRRRRNSHKILEAQSSCKGSGDEAKSTGLECAVTDAQSRSKRFGNEAKITYSIKEMEALRFIDLETQKKRWVEVYCGLAPAVQEEFDALVNCDHKKLNQIDFDPRKQFQNVQRSGSVHGEDCSQVVDNVTENVSPSNPNSECSEEDEDDDDCNSILKPAFFVSGKPKFDSGPPQDGLEYLRRVRWEAERIPNVKVVKLEKKKLNKEQTVYMPNIPDIAKCPEHLLPMKEWEDMFLADFSELRLAFSRVDISSASSSSILKLPSSLHEQQNNTQHLGNLVEKISNIISNEFESLGNPNSCKIDNESLDCKTSGSGSSKEIPTLSVILKMDSVARLSTLRKRIKSVDKMTSISKNDFMWVFALCIVIDTPLDGDMSASLRCLLRKVASLRAEKTQVDDEVIMLNIIAMITGKYFGQSG